MLEAEMIFCNAPLYAVNADVESRVVETTGAVSAAPPPGISSIQCAAKQVWTALTVAHLGRGASATSEQRAGAPLS